MRPTLLLALPLALSAGKGGGVQHCADAAGDARTSCVEVRGDAGLGLFGSASVGLTLTTLCTVIGADPAPGPCPDAGKVGGCQEVDGDGLEATSWTYEGTLDDLSCSSDEVKIGPDGAPVTEDTDTPGADRVCSGPGGAAVSFTVTHTGTEPFTMYWIDPRCDAQPYGVVQPGGTFAQDSFVQHVWQARAGESDPAGEVLWEHRLAEGDGGAAFDVP